MTRCAFCWQEHEISVVEFQGVLVQSCPHIRTRDVWHIPAVGEMMHRIDVQPETLPAIKAAEPALELIEANVPSDTERPPPPPIDQRKCYFCGEPAVDIIHCDMPACDSCKRRALGRRRDQ